jgi:hypothetical protein
VAEGVHTTSDTSQVASRTEQRASVPNAQLVGCHRTSFCVSAGSASFSSVVCAHLRPQGRGRNLGSPPSVHPSERGTTRLTAPSGGACERTSCRFSSACTLHRQDPNKSAASRYQMTTVLKQCPCTARGHPAAQHMYRRVAGFAPARPSPAMTSSAGTSQIQHVLPCAKTIYRENWRAHAGAPQEGGRRPHARNGHATPAPRPRTRASGKRTARCEEKTLRSAQGNGTEHHLCGVLRVICHGAFVTAEAAEQGGGLLV